uniref:Tight junction-associated protein 1 n=1 Tax=Strigamia maritima TaxID=126957 RepID=T1IMK8_STRMM
MELSCGCKECGCHCNSCFNNNSLHLHQEIEELKKKLMESENHVMQMDTNVILQANKYPNGEYFALKEEISHWQEKYERLYDSHKKLQKVNQGLEDKLLKIVDKYETEKSSLTKDMAEVTTRLVDARVSISELEEENERYRSDCSLAVQLLQCKPSNFVSHRVDSLPADLQQKVKHHLNQKRRDLTLNQNNNTSPVAEVRTIRVPIPTFPPTAMVYSVNQSKVDRFIETEDNLNSRSNDLVSAAVMAKVLEERAKERSAKKHQMCLCRSVRSDHVSSEKGTQTHFYQNLDPAATWNQMSSISAINSRTQSESSNSSYDQTSVHCWSRTGSTSTSSSTETQI